jgi:hypothetical protein
MFVAFVIGLTLIMIFCLPYVQKLEIKNESATGRNILELLDDGRSVVDSHRSSGEDNVSIELFTIVVDSSDIICIKKHW